MSEKNTLRTRLVNKHDIEANWLKATNFTPLQGELIVYDADENYNYERIKMGDGVTNVNELPFISPQVDWNQNDENAPDYVKNRTHWEEGVILPETELAAFEIEGATQYPILLSPLAQVEVGKKYVVVYNNTAYDIEAKFDEGDGVYSLAHDFGGVALFPEAIEYPSVGMIYGLVFAMDGSTPITLSIVEKDAPVHKLAPKFLPDIVVMAEPPVRKQVILPETELAPHEVDGQVVGFIGNPTLSAYPEIGKIYTVTVDGVPYELEAQLLDGAAGFVPPDETFAILIVPPESVEQLGFSVGVEWQSEEIPESVTLSIVQMGAAVPKQLVMDKDGNIKWEDRTHYDEIIPDVAIWADDAPELMFSGDGTSLFMSSIAPIHSLIDGQEYTVVINGVEYVRNCTYMSDGIEGYYCLGNIDLMMETGNNGDPFVIMLLPPELFDPNDPLGAIIYDLSGALDGTGVSATAVTASVSGPTIVTHKIDEKYLPDSTINVSPNWDASEGQDGHVLNRTHWIDPEGTVVVDADISLSAGKASASGGSAYTCGITLVPNSAYIVQWGNTEYVCVAHRAETSSWSSDMRTYIGNGSKYHGAENTGEPFCIAINDDGNNGLICAYANTPAISHVTVTVGPGGAYHQIDDRFVNFPETVNSDWDANEVEEGHILNRTHWVEHDVPVILQNPEFELYEIGEIKCYMLLTKPNRLPTEGEVWRIKVDGIVYECEAHKQGHNEIAFGCMGNREDDNSEPQYQTWAVSDAPFLFVFNVNAGEDATSYGVFWPYSTIGLPTLIEGGDIVHKISRDYTRSIKLFDGLGKCSIRGGAAEQESALYQMGDAAFAIGKSTKASGNNSFAGGGYSEAIGARSQAFGYRSKTLNADSQAIGYYATAIGYRSHAEGEYTTAYGENSHAEGSSYTNITYQLTGDAGAKQYTVYNYNGEEIPDMSPYVGAAVFDGQGLSTGAVITGASGSTIYLSQTLSESAALSKGYFAIRFGVACGDDSHAEGTGTIAFGAASHSEGFQTRANGDSSHAEGNQTCANGNYSHAEGSVTSANGVGSHAEGIETIASSRCQHVQGIFNIEDSNKVYAHIVGNGYFDSDTSSEVRSNAHAVDWSGNAYYAGDVYVQGDGKTSGFSGKKKLSTEEYVESYAASLIPTPEDAVALMIEMGFVDPVADETGAMYTDDNGKIFTY